MKTDQRQGDESSLVTDATSELSAYCDDCRAAKDWLAALPYVSQPRKLDNTLTWQQNYERAQEMARAALALANGVTSDKQGK